MTNKKKYSKYKIRVSRTRKEPKSSRVSLKWLMKWISCDLRKKNLTCKSHRSGCHSCRRFSSSSISKLTCRWCCELEMRNRKTFPSSSRDCLLKSDEPCEQLKLSTFISSEFLCAHSEEIVLSSFGRFFTCYGNSRKSRVHLTSTCVHIQRMHDMLLMEEMKNILMRRW